jgi:large subunit ribosomal protein L10
MAISRKQKEELVVQYIDWMNSSQALIFTGYRGLSVKEFDDLRRKVREAGGEFHVIKNTLGKVAFEQAGVPLPEEYLEESTAIAFAFDDPAALAKAVKDFSRSSDFLKIKGGYLEQIPIQTEQITALADLPPLPILRAGTDSNPNRADHSTGRSATITDIARTAAGHNYGACQPACTCLIRTGSPGVDSAECIRRKRRRVCSGLIQYYKI